MKKNLLIGGAVGLGVTVLGGAILVISKIADKTKKSVLEEVEKENKTKTKESEVKEKENVADVKEEKTENIHNDNVNDVNDVKEDKKAQ